ncbi:MAG: metallophosphoesterase [Acidobacteriota bacterium]|nr:metallophosphoesterase [Acidobacteriota bacterium]
MRKTLIIGDVHGCSAELEDLLNAAGYDSRMELFFVGDLINKGPDSPGVLRRAYEAGAKVVLGNHERSFLKYLRKQKEGNEHFEKVKRDMGRDLKFWVNYIQSWPLYLEQSKFLMVHAGLEPGKSPRESRPRILTNIRTWDGWGKVLEAEGDPPWYHFYTDKKLVVFGHWALRGLIERPNAVGLDTGCVYGGRLSGLLLPERRIVQVPARRVYCVPTLPESNGLE